MSRRGLAPAVLGRINPLTHTPLVSTWLVTAVIAGFAISLPLAALASITSAVMLVVFLMVTLSLIRLRRTQPRAEGLFRVWPWVPALSLLLNLGLLGYQLWSLMSD
jgi:amino acid transporter